MKDDTPDKYTIVFARSNFYFGVNFRLGKVREWPGLLALRLQGQLYIFFGA